MANNHAERMKKVYDYIGTHLNDDLSVDILSEIACFSKFHFHRQFSAYMGINVQKLVQALRLKRASYQLVFHQDIQIINIALDARFENPESFSRAFKKTFGQTPSQFRKQPDWALWHEKYNFNKPTGGDQVDIKIIDFKTTKIAALEHRGDRKLLNESILKFIQWRKESQLSPIKHSKTYGIAYDDPEITEPEAFRFDICGEVKEQIPENEYGIINKEIPGGRCAVLRHLGSRDHMREKIYHVYGSWLPQREEEFRNYPLFFHYLNFFPEVQEAKLITDIYFPLK